MVSDFDRIDQLQSESVRNQLGKRDSTGRSDVSKEAWWSKLVGYDSDRLDM